MSKDRIYDIRAGLSTGFEVAGNNLKVAGE